MSADLTPWEPGEMGERTAVLVKRGLDAAASLVRLRRSLALPSHRTDLRFAAWLPDGQHVLAVGDFDGEITIWDTATRARTACFDLRGMPSISAIEVAPS